MEQEQLSRDKGTEKLPALKPAEQVEIDIGQFHIGGHRHGSSSGHENKLAGWKVIATQSGRTIEFHHANKFRPS